MVAIFINTDARVLNTCYFLTSDVACCYLNPREAPWTREPWRSHVLRPGLARSEGLAPERAPANCENLPQCGGEGWDTETTLPKKNFSICIGNSVSLFHTREDSAASRRLRGRPSAKHKRNAFYPRSPAPLTCAPSLLWFLFLQLVVSKPLPGIVEVLPE